MVAIAFGSIHNLTTRKFVAFDPTTKKGFLTKLKSFFRRGNKSEEEKTNVEEKEETDLKKEDKTEDETHKKSLKDINKEKAS